MSYIEDIANTELDNLLEHIELGELNIVHSHINRQDMSEELLDIIVAPKDDTHSRLGMAHP